MAKTYASPKVYLKRDEQEVLLGADFLKAFDATRAAHKEAWANLEAIASEHVTDVPEGHVIKLSPGFGDTLGISYVKAKNGKAASGGDLNTKLATLGVKAKAPAVLLGANKKPKGGAKAEAAPYKPSFAK